MIWERINREIFVHIFTQVIIKTKKSWLVLLNKIKKESVRFFFYLILSTERISASSFPIALIAR